MSYVICHIEVVGLIGVCHMSYRRVGLIGVCHIEEVGLIYPVGTYLS
jgi:hypothetical protein